MLCLLSPLVDGASLRLVQNYLWRTSIFLCQFVVIMSLVLYVITVVFGDIGRLLLIVVAPDYALYTCGYGECDNDMRFLSRENRVSRYHNYLTLCRLWQAIIVMVWAEREGDYIVFVG